MINVKHRIHKAFKSTVEFVTPARSVTAFKDRGVLTPDEFVMAGDNLVDKCRTWEWDCGDPSKRKPYLPVEKQFLITRNVPCLRRAICAESDYREADDLVVDSDMDGGWLATNNSGAGDPGDEAEKPIPSMDSAQKAEEGEVEEEVEEEDDDDIPDMDGFEEPDDLDNDPATLPPTYLVAHEPDDDHILRTRTYDLTITYDKYYQTPRVWLFGYDESRNPLPPHLIFEDVSQDHAKKTVTIDDHPNLGAKYASIHPCRHGMVMKKIVTVLAERGGEPRVDQYLFIFLKFIASIIPTIEYDYTIEFDLGQTQLGS